MKIKDLLEFGRNNLIKKEEPVRLSQILLAHLLKVNRQYLLINNEEEVAENIEKAFKEKIEAIKQGKPIQYVTNQQEFMGLKFFVNENVLIPQPDTEVLVEEVMSLCRQKENVTILDLCTGSGAVGISLAKILPNVTVTLSDISEKALEIAHKNAKENGVIEKCRFVKSNLFEEIEEKFNVIVSNPPYIATGVISTLSLEVQNEPKIALDGGKDGLDFYRLITKEASDYLKLNGILALEIGFDQKEAVMQLLKQSGKYTNIYSKKDLSGKDRVVVCVSAF